MKKKGTNWIIIILIVLLILSFGYIINGKIQERKNQEQLIIYQQGMQAGYEQAVVNLIEEAITCQQVPIIYQNKSLSVVAVDCIR